MNPFIELSDEIVLNILKWLSCKDLSNVAMTSNRFNLLAHDKELRLLTYKKNTIAYRFGDLYIIFKTRGKWKEMGITHAHHYYFKILEPQDLKPRLSNERADILKLSLRGIETGDETFNKLLAAINNGSPELLSTTLLKLGCDSMALRIKTELEKSQATKMQIAYRSYKSR